MLLYNIPHGFAINASIIVYQEITQPSHASPRNMRRCILCFLL